MKDPISMSRRLSWLTPRERMVLAHLAAGLSAEQIAAVDFVATTSVRTHIRGILLKLGVSNQKDAVVAVYRQLVDPEAVADLVGAP
jgi:DNA-binding CsgD family transcriptional regulator